MIPASAGSTTYSSYKTMTDTTIKSDNLQRFIFDNAPIRGEWVHLTDTWQHIIKRRQYPAAIQKILGEMIAAAALLAATVKIKGRLVLQTKSTGPVDMIMVECTSNNTLRGFAQWSGDIADNATLAELTGEGTLAITIEVEGAKAPYQGIVNLQDDSIAHILEAYFKQSEQLETKIWLAANDQVAAGLLLQQLPNEQQDDEDWSRISQLANTITPQELLELGYGTLLHRLFNEEACRLLTNTELSFSCNCSRDRVVATISLLGEEDAFKLLKEQGNIEVACEFCNEHYLFDHVDIAQVFSNSKLTKSNADTLH